MMPALQINMSNGGADDESSSAHFAMESRSVSSQAMGRALPLIFAQAVRAASSVRAAPMTSAPRNESTRIVSRPRPELQPVTTAVLPRRSMPAVTSSAVDRRPNLLLVGFSGSVDMLLPSDFPSALGEHSTES